MTATLAPQKTTAPTGPPADPLDAGLLCDIASGLAAADDLWRPHAHHGTDRRRPVRLLVADNWEAWVIGWTPGQHVELHDHGPSAGTVVLVEGRLVNVSPRTADRTHEELRPGHATHLPPGTVHDVVAAGSGPATSIHVYSPPLTAMTFYDADGNATHTVAVADEPPVTDLRTGPQADDR